MARNGFSNLLLNHTTLLVWIGFTKLYDPAPVALKRFYVIVTVKRLLEWRKGEGSRFSNEKNKSKQDRKIGWCSTRSQSSRGWQSLRYVDLHCIGNVMVNNGTGNLVHLHVISILQASLTQVKQSYKPHTYLTIYIH